MDKGHPPHHYSIEILFEMMLALTYVSDTVADVYVSLHVGQWRTQEFFFRGGLHNSVEDRGQRERGSGGGSPIVRGSGGSCNLVQEISFHTVKLS
jgi:hypothetical protein